MSEQRSAAALNPEFEAVLRTCFDGLIPPDTPLQEDSDLADFGIDSLIVVRLLVSLEDSFGVTIPDEMLTFELFSSPGALWNIITNLLEETGGH